MPMVLANVLFERQLCFGVSLQTRHLDEQLVLSRQLKIDFGRADKVRVLLHVENGNGCFQFF